MSKIVPINTKDFAAKIFRSERVAQKAIAAGQYKGVSLIVRTDNSKRGRPAYFVLWNTEFNRPATEAEAVGFNQSNRGVSEEKEKLDSDYQASERARASCSNNRGGVGDDAIGFDRQSTSEDFYSQSQGKGASECLDLNQAREVSDGDRRGTPNVATVLHGESETVKNSLGNKKTECIGVESPALVDCGERTGPAGSERESARFGGLGSNLGLNSSVGGVNGVEYQGDVSGDYSGFAEGYCGFEADSSGRECGGFLFDGTSDTAHGSGIEGCGEESQEGVMVRPFDKLMAHHERVLGSANTVINSEVNDEYAGVVSIAECGGVVGEIECDGIGLGDRVNDSVAGNVANSNGVVDGVGVVGDGLDGGAFEGSGWGIECAVVDGAESALVSACVVSQADENAGVRGEAQAVTRVSSSQGVRSEVVIECPDDWTLETDRLPVVEAANIEVYPEAFECQMRYVLRLIELHKLGKVCKSTVLKSYFSTVLVPELVRSEWDALSNNQQRTAFAIQHRLVGDIPARLRAKGNPKSQTGRKASVPEHAVQWIINKVNAWVSEDSTRLASTRERTVKALAYTLSEDTGIVLSHKQVATIVKKHNLRPLMDKPEGKEGKKVGKKKGTYPRLPVNSLWLMDGVVPELLYIKGENGRYTKITCIGIEDVGSRVLLGFREYYSESGASSVNLFKAVMSNNQFREGSSSELVKPTLRPDKGSGFMTSMGACCFAISKAYAEKHHFVIDFKEAHAGSPTEKSHLESAWKSVHSFYKLMVREHFAKLGKIDKTPIVDNHKRGIEQSALYLDITLDELRAAGLAEKFRQIQNNSKRNFTEDNKTIAFVPNQRWSRYLAGLSDDQPIPTNNVERVFSLEADALEMLNVFGYAKHEATVKPDMSIQFKVGYNVPRDLGFSVTRSTPVRVSEMPDGTGRLAIFTAKEKQSKTKHDFGAEFLGFATVKAIGGNTEKAAHVRRKKEDRVSNIVELSKQETAYHEILKEIQVFLVSFGTESDKKGLDTLVGMRLTPELAKAWIQELCVDADGVLTKIEFKRFSFEARKRLQNILVLPVKQHNVR